MLCCTENRGCELSRVITLRVRKASIVAARGKQNERAACPKDMLEFNFFFLSSTDHYHHTQKWKKIKIKPEIKLKQNIYFA